MDQIQTEVTGGDVVLEVLNQGKLEAKEGDVILVQVSEDFEGTERTEDTKSHTVH